VKYLIDTSALVRIIRKQADLRWDDVIDRGLISICGPAETETLLLAETKKYAEMEEFIAERYLSVTIPDGVWDLVAAIRRELAPHGVHRGRWSPLSPAAQSGTTGKSWNRAMKTRKQMAVVRPIRRHLA
jgi:predicted nucleic acid-binding protein